VVRLPWLADAPSTDGIDSCYSGTCWIKASQDGHRRAPRRQSEADLSLDRNHRVGPGRAGAIYAAARPPVPTKLDPYKATIMARLETYNACR